MLLTSKITGIDEWPGIASRFQLVVVVASRSKQLQRGSLPRVEADTRRRKNTSIALEEVKRGLVPFTSATGEQKVNGKGVHPSHDVEHELSKL